MKKRILSTLLALCMVLGLCSVGAVAQGIETEVLVLKDGPLVITPDSYTYGYEEVTVPFTGDYILDGTIERMTFSGGDNQTYHVVCHGVDIYAGQKMPFYFENSNTTVHLTVYGGLFISAWHTIFDSAEGAQNNQIIITLATGSLLDFYLETPTDTIFGNGVSVVDQQGNALVNQSDMENYFRVYQSDERVYHYNQTVKGEHGCEYHCDDCDLIDGITAPHTPDDATFVDNNTCQLTCRVCERTYTDSHTCAGYHYVDDEYCAEFCVFCGENYYYLDHGIQYEAVEDGHVRSCFICEYTWDDQVLPHNFTYYKTIDDKTCAMVCEDCEFEMEPTPHSYENGDYGTVDTQYCAPACDNCHMGAYDNPELYELHDFSEYSSYDDAFCVASCSRCAINQQDENGNLVLTPHEFGEKTSVPATALEEECVAQTCEMCDHTAKKYNKDKSIVIDMPTYVYEDGGGATDEMGGVIVYRNGELWKHVSNESQDQNALPFDPEASYVFKVLPTTTPETSITIWAPHVEESVFHSDNLLADGYGMYDTLYAYNVADYTQLQAELDKIPDDMSVYTQETALAVAEAVKNIKRMLPASRQSEVDRNTQQVKAAVDALQERKENDPAHGVVHLAGSCIAICEEYYEIYDGATWEMQYEKEYQGNYVLFGSRVIDEPRKEEYNNGAFWVYDGISVNVDIANVWSVGNLSGAGLYDGCSVNLTLFGNNVIADGSINEEIPEEYAGITVSEGNALTIGGSGSLLALGQDNCAGIGGINGDDYSEGDNAGDITINSGTVFALTAGDAAGIGGGYKGGAGNITINGGTIYANCLHDDGTGIGTGEDGEGGSVTINGGHITALSYDDDGAGIGSGDKGHIDSITIHGGVVIAGSDDGAAIGGGSDGEGYGGKITIDGGLIAPHIHHDEEEYFIGNGSSNSVGANEDNFVKINGGTVITEGSMGVYPLVADDTTIAETQLVALKENKPFKIASEHGVVVVAPFDGVVTAFASEGTYTYVGDADCDGNITASDALDVLKMAVGKVQPANIHRYAADVDGDHQPEASDALEILKFVVGKPSDLA